MINTPFSTCSRKHLQLLVWTSIYGNSQSLASGMLMGLCFRNCQLWSDLEWMDSTSQNTSDKCSSVNNLSRIITFWERFPDSTRDSHIPPNQGLIGAVNFKFIFFATRCLVAEFWSMLFMACFNSFEAPTKFVSFSNLMFTVPLFEMNLFGGSMNTSIERSPAISRWTALVVEQVNRATYLQAVAWLDIVLLKSLTLSWRQPLSYRNQSIDFLSKMMDWFLYDIDLLYKAVNVIWT